MKVKVVFYSMCGHISRTAKAVSEGAREFEAVEVQALQVAELVPDEVSLWFSLPTPAPQLPLQDPSLIAGEVIVQ